MQKITNNLKLRVNIDGRMNNGNLQLQDNNVSSIKNLQTRLDYRGGSNQWKRMREDKLRSLRKALLYSYQSAIVQKYDVKKESIINNLSDIIVLLQDNKQLSDSQIKILQQIETQYSIQIEDRYTEQYINEIQIIIDHLKQSEPYFRCLINHDKLKVAYEDKIISIPFMQPAIGSNVPIETNFTNGTVFKWIHGNKEEWTPDTYWIIYMQYSEETAYFRAEIRKADEEIEIITIDNEGNEQTSTYRGWMTGPNETSIAWNIKKNIVWNDLNYTKLLYITKDEDTVAFFERFDRVIINGKPWQIQAYNEDYSKSATSNAGIIRVALKETYTNTDQHIEQELDAAAAERQNRREYDANHTEPRIDGPSEVEPYAIVTYTAKNFEPEYDERQRIILKHWTLYGTPLAKIINTSVDGLMITVEILSGVSNKQGFYVNYGDQEETMVHVSIKSF